MAGAIGGAAGAVGGLLGQQKEGGKTAGNVFLGDNPDMLNTQLRNKVGPDFLFNNTFGSNPYVNNGTGQATEDVQNNPMLSQLFGKGGTLDNTVQQQKDQAANGFSLQPEDHTSYGQAMGNITRQFDNSDQSLAQSMSARGLSNSGVAAQGFATQFGNKNEQLAQQQQQIAKQRFDSNLQRLGQTQQFLGQLSGQASGNINDAYNRGFQGANQQYNIAKDQSQGAQNYLGAEQGQQNNGLQQEQATQHGNALSSAFNGALGGAQAGMGMANSMSSTNLNNALTSSLTPKSPMGSAGGSYFNTGAIG